MTDILFQPLGNPTAAGVDLEHIADIDPRLTRTNYFDGRLLKAEDLTRDQIYLDERLREVGRVLGGGVVNGLKLSFNRYNGLLTLNPGKAVTAAGRVLELGTDLIVNLGNRALIAQLNDGGYRRLNRALYAVVLRYAEVATDIAEVFPTDLGAQRAAQYARITEAVQMGLVPLRMPLAQQNDLQIRARLMRACFDDPQAGGLIPEDAVALGVLAIQDDTPQWLDAELLRHPLRAEPGAGDLQADLGRQYESLLTEVLTSRRAGGLTGDFAAADYFSLLPPAGSVPKEAIDPVIGRQGYFPENYQVAIAPVRMSDVDLIKAESMALPPIDLARGEPVDIVVLAPLSNQEYGQFARQLETAFDPGNRRLPQLDLLRLKLYPVTLDLDTSAWTNIWSRVEAAQLFYVRRPTRAAETGISAIVLARGAVLPASVPPAASPADAGSLLEDDNAIFLRRLSIDKLAAQRPPVDDDGKKALTDLKTEFAGDSAAAAGLVVGCLNLLLRIDTHYDAVVWQTLLTLADAKKLDDFLQELSASDATAPLGGRVATLGAGFGLDNALLARWKALDA